jgi:hypothetical protein
LIEGGFFIERYFSSFIFIPLNKQLDQTRIFCNRPSSH